MDDQHNDDIELSPLLESLAEEYAESPKSRKFLPLAEEYRKSRMYSEAIYLLQEGLKNHPSFLPAKITLARCYVDTNEWEDAMILLEEINLESPNNVPVLRMLGETFMGRGEFIEAAETYKTVLALNPEDRVSKEKLGEIEEELGGEIDISSLETPLLVTEKKETEQVDDDLPIEDDLRLDLRTEDQVDFDELTLPEEQSMEISEIELAIPVSGDPIEASQEQQAFRERLEDEEEPVSNSEMQMLDPDDLSEEEIEEEELSIDSFDTLDLELPDDQEELESAPEILDSEEVSLDSEEDGFAGEEKDSQEDEESPFSVPDEEDISDLESALAFDSPEILEQQQESMDAYEFLSKEDDDTASEVNFEEFSDDDESQEQLESVTGYSDESRDKLDEIKVDESGVQEDTGEAIEIGQMEPSESDSSEERESLFDDDDDILELSIADIVDEEVTQESTIEIKDRVEDHPEQGIITKLIHDYEDEEQIQLIDEAFELSIDDIESQGKPPGLDSFEIHESHDADSGEGGIFDISLDDGQEEELSQPVSNLQLDEEESAEQSGVEHPFFNEVDDSQTELISETELGEVANDVQESEAPDSTEIDLDDLIPVTESSAKVFRDQGDLKKTRDIYRKLVQVHPENPSYAEALHKVEEELVAADKALEEDPEIVIELLENWLENIKLYKNSQDLDGRGE